MDGRFAGHRKIEPESGRGLERWKRKSLEDKISQFGLVASAIWITHKAQVRMDSILIWACAAAAWLCVGWHWYRGGKKEPKPAISLNLDRSPSDQAYGSRPEIR